MCYHETGSLLTDLSGIIVDYCLCMWFKRCGRDLFSGRSHWQTVFLVHDSPAGLYLWRYFDSRQALSQCLFFTCHSKPILAKVKDFLLERRKYVPFSAHTDS